MKGGLSELVAAVERQEDAAETGDDAPRRRRVQQVRLRDDGVFPLKENEEQLFMPLGGVSVVMKLHDAVLQRQIESAT